MNAWLGRAVSVRIELPAWSFVKRRADGAVDLVSPLPCPWAYGALPEVAGGDGDPLDAIVLDVSGRRGESVPTIVQGVVRFTDAGQIDDKLVCAQRPPTARERAAVVGFLRGFAAVKRGVQRLRGRRGETRVGEVVWA
jgi:inorganic pyrophosphatase